MSITNYEKQYMTALKAIYQEGHEDGVNERTGRATKRLPGITFHIDVEKEFPILKSKFVAGITALSEILWIWQNQSNNIHDLKAHIWDSWADHNGSIQKAYGYQINQPVCIYTDPIHKTPETFRSYKSQAEYVIEYLREFPTGRWAVATLWNVNELSGMNLVPCCHTTTWNLDGGRLNCVLDQRSGDMPYGVPFNTTQYAELMILIARDLGVKPGILTHVIADAHIYDNQMEGVEEQIAYWDLLESIEMHYTGCCKREEIEDKAKHAAEICNRRNPEGESKTVENMIKTAVAAYDNEPKFKVDETDSTSFFEVKREQCHIESYSNMGKVDFGDVAV